MGSNAQFWYASFSLVHDRPKTLKNDINMITNSQLLDKSKSGILIYILYLDSLCCPIFLPSDNLVEAPRKGRMLMY